MKKSELPKAGEEVRVLVPGTLVSCCPNHYEFRPEGDDGLYMVDPSVCEAYKHFIVKKEGK